MNLISWKPAAASRMPSHGSGKSLSSFIAATSSQTSTWKSLVEEHFRKGNDVTLALRNTGLAAGVSLSADGRVDRYRDRTKRVPEPLISQMYRSGIPKSFRRIPAGRKISFVPILADWLRNGGKIGGVVLNDREWFNIGSRDEYLAVHRTISERRLEAGLPEGGSTGRSGSRGDATWRPRPGFPGFYAVGAGCVVESRSDPRGLHPLGRSND